MFEFAFEFARIRLFIVACPAVMPAKVHAAATAHRLRKPASGDLSIN
jgi:hypothetical protein